MASTESSGNIMREVVETVGKILEKSFWERVLDC